MSGPHERQGGWRPTASRAVLEKRAQLLARARAFLAARGILEVETPLIVNAAVTDVHIHSARIELEGVRGYFLHTSPEYAMKRLLAAGSGDIFQICHVVRGFERSRLHNPEFTLIEWYRLGFSLERLMSEVEALVRELLGEAGKRLAAERIAYREAFRRELALDPLAADLDEIERVTRTLGYRAVALPGAETAVERDAQLEREPGPERNRHLEREGEVERDTELELLMATLVGPNLGRDGLTFVHRYPATQAALARLDPEDPDVALRFELYARGVELANGFEELTSEGEQRARFERDRAERRRRGLPVFDTDERLLAALSAGLPPCAGVALGFDRVVMLAVGARHIEEVLAFPIDRA